MCFRSSTALACVICGGIASKGSLKNPYCQKCFDKEFGSNDSKFWESQK
jgi:hypothetical protein